MAIETVAVVAPGDMGHAVADVLRRNGLRVVTTLGGRGPDSVARANRAGMVALANLQAVTFEADAFLSILPPSRALDLAGEVAACLKTTRKPLLYVDCNAVSPETVRAIGAVIAASGGRFVDAGIIGAPPKPEGKGPRFYASGLDAPAFAELGKHGLDIRLIGQEVGQASALKMCYAAMSKGLTALATEALTAARLLGVDEAMKTELQGSQPTILDYATRALPSMPPKAYRWIGEMEEIAATFAAVGLPPGMLQGAADVYRFVGQSPLGRERTEERTQGKTLEDAVAGLAKTLGKR
jgi:3-hydroxyisobutyrate dehydrogenase-like beta-hydroxyacid dehydrogenase